MSRLLDPEFKYTPAAAQNVTETWKRAGFKPTTQAERLARRKPKQIPANVRELKRAAK